MANKTSCIRYTPNTQLVLIRAELISIFTDAPDSACAAAIMNVFAYWTDIKLESIKQAKIENEIARREGKEPTQDESLWIYKSNGELTHTDLMSIWGEKKVGDCLRWLVECGLILSRRNPRFGYDRTLQYMLDADAFQECIDTKLLPKPQNCAMESAELRDQSRKIALTIPKTTTEITQRVSTPAVAGNGKKPSKTKQPKVVEFPKERSKDLLFESVLFYGFGIKYTPLMDVPERTAGRVRGVVKELKAGNVDPQKFLTFCEGYKAWSKGLTFPRDAVALLASFNQWNSEQSDPADPTTDARWTATHAAWVHALEIPKGDWPQYLTRSEERIREDLTFHASMSPNVAEKLAEVGYVLELEAVTE